MVSKALVVAAYQRKAEEIARLGVDLTVLVPPVWADSRGRQEARPLYTEGYNYRIIPIRLGGHYHLHYYPTLAAELSRLGPHVLHMDEEPYNFATWKALRTAARTDLPATFFTWQNLYRTYPPPFRWMEQANYRHSPVAIAGNHEAEMVLRRKGYAGSIHTIPQFGVDPDLYAPSLEPRTGNPIRIGYAGGLLPEKGVDLILDACAGLQGDWTVEIAGSGGERPQLEAQASRLGLADRVTFHGPLRSTDMPAFYRELDIFVLPRRTTPGWKEQFGRDLVEAMACALPVIGSDSGEIPHVIGDAGLIFAEGEVADLRTRIQSLLANPDARLELGEAGRQRVVERFTMAQVAAHTVRVYEELVAV